MDIREEKKKIYAVDLADSSASDTYVVIDDGSDRLKGKSIESIGGTSVDRYVAEVAYTSPIEISSGLLEIGKLYTITGFSAGDDFTNVANVKYGIINTDGCVFEATGTTPTTWTNGTYLSYDMLDISELINSESHSIEMYAGGSTGSILKIIETGSFVEHNYFAKMSNPSIEITRVDDDTLTSGGALSEKKYILEIEFI